MANNTLVINANPAVTCAGGNLNIERDANGNPLQAATLNGKEVLPSRYVFKYCLVESLAFSMNVQALALSEQMSIVFASMEISNS